MAAEMLGKEVTAQMNVQIEGRVEALRKKGISPALLMIRVGENPGDLAYERSASKRCETLGVEVKKKIFPADVTQAELTDAIHEANEDVSVHGVLMFRPLPKHLDEAFIANELSPGKDVDAMTDLSMSGVFTGKNIGFAPCTAQACMEILDYYKIGCAGKKAVVIGRSLVIGKPAAMLLLGKNATVTVCHTKTLNMAEIAREADILIAAAGHAKMVTGDFIRPGQVVLDVGINLGEDGKLCGDVDYEAAFEKASFITPVPRGVGSVTASVLVKHVIEAAESASL